MAAKHKAIPTKAPSIPVDMTEESLREAFKDFPAVELLTRRFTNAGDPGSLPVLLKDEDPDSCINSEHQHHVKPNQTHCTVKDKATGKRCGKPVRKWFVYWVNTAKQGRWSQITAKAYVAVEVKELRDEMDVADLVKKEEAGARVVVRRGDRGQEVLCKQPLAAWNIIKNTRRADAKARMQSAAARRNARAEALGRKFGDEAGEFAYQGGIREESFKRERTTLGEEAAGVDVIEE